MIENAVCHHSTLNPSGKMNSLRPFLTSGFLYIISSAAAFADLGNRYVLQPVWSTQTPAGDRLSTIFTSERDAYNSDGCIFYTPLSSPSTQTVYRLFNGSNDHMDSLLTSEGGYSEEGALYQVWPTDTYCPGLAQIWRGINLLTGDHATQPYGEFANYNMEGVFGYGFPRYGNNAESLINISNSILSIDSNMVAGGCVWNWTWNGIQFINKNDYGREMQTTVSWRDPATGLWDDPTEAGDTYSNQLAGSGYYRQPEDRHGSPLISATNSAPGIQQITQCAPLDFNAAFGGNSSQPVVYTQVQVGKTITICTYSPSSNATVVLYSTQINWTGASAVSPVNIEIPTAYLRWTFNTITQYNASTGSTNDGWYDDPYDSTAQRYSPAAGGIIASDVSGNAMGFYRDNYMGPTSDSFGYWLYSDGSGGTGEYDWSTVKLQAKATGVTLSQGMNKYNLYIITGSLLDVEEEMTDIYEMHYWDTIWGFPF